MPRAQWWGHSVCRPGEQPHIERVSAGAGVARPQTQPSLGLSPHAPSLARAWVSPRVPNMDIQRGVLSMSQPGHPLGWPLTFPTSPSPACPLVSQTCPCLGVSPCVPSLPNHCSVTTVSPAWPSLGVSPPCPKPCQALGHPNCDCSPHVLNTAILIVSPTWPSLQASPHVPNLSIPGVAPQCPQPVLFPGVSSPRPSLQLSPTWSCLEVSPACLSPEVSPPCPQLVHPLECPHPVHPLSCTPMSPTWPCHEVSPACLSPRVSPAWPRRGRPPRAPPQPSPRQ